MTEEEKRTLRRRIDAFLRRPDVAKADVRSYLAKHDTPRARRRFLPLLIAVLALAACASLLVAFHKPSRLALKRNAAAASHRVLRFVRRHVVMAGWIDIEKWASYHDSQCLVDNPYYKDRDRCRSYGKFRNIVDIRRDEYFVKFDDFRNAGAPVVVRDFLRDNETGVDYWMGVLSRRRSELESKLCDAGSVNEDLFKNKSLCGEGEGDERHKVDFCSGETLGDVFGVSRPFLSGRVSPVGQLFIRCPFTENESFQHDADMPDSLFVFVQLSGRSRIAFHPLLDCSQSKRLATVLQRGDIAVFSPDHWFTHFMAQGDEPTLAYAHQVGNKVMQGKKHND